MEDNITNPEQSQLNPADISASLGFATNILQQHLASQIPQQAAQNPSDTPPDGQGEAKTPLRDKYAPEEESSELGAVKEELKSLKEDILKAIKEDDNGEQTETEKSIEEA